MAADAAGAEAGQAALPAVIPLLVIGGWLAVMAVILALVYRYGDRILGIR